MTRFGKKLHKTFKRFGLSQSGAATVELVIIFPFFLGVFLSSYDVAIMNMRAVMLEQAMDKAVRRIRISSGAVIDYNTVVNDICEDAFLIPDCNTALRLEMSAVDKTTWTGITGALDCIDRTATIQPVVKWENGSDNELMLIRACVVVDPVFAGIGVGRSMPKDASGGYRVSASSAFVNEPL
ncbi:MAG: TadE/TadG family type IV pilus assembly protein [Pseudomonadota bacterium]